MWASHWGHWGLGRWFGGDGGGHCIGNRSARGQMAWHGSFWGHHNMVIERCGGDGDGDYIGNICNGGARMVELAWREDWRGRRDTRPS